MLNGKVREFFLTFGRVPFFFYIIHFYLAHIMGIVYNGIGYNEWGVFIFDDPQTWPAGYTPNLLIVYLLWMVLIGLMYYLCRWFGEVKKLRTEWWLKYL
jgi:hypothetical protein